MLQDNFSSHILFESIGRTYCIAEAMFCHSLFYWGGKNVTHLRVGELASLTNVAGLTLQVSTPTKLLNCS